MAVVKLTYQEEQLIHNAARKSGFENFDVDAVIGTFKGDNYLGVITTITVKEKNDEKILHLILKSAHTNENFRKGAPIAKAFAREAYIYNTILPQLFKIQTEKGVSNPFTGAATYYDCCLEDVNESILMKNLKEFNYKLWDRKVPMNDEHVTLVFSEYARFHAASLAFRHHHPEEFNQLTEDLQMNIFETDEPNPEMIEGIVDMYFKNGFSGVEGNIKATAALEKLRQKVTTLFFGGRGINDDKSVILHGDCWCNNFLFHYEDDSSTPTRVCLIDWQISKLGSPVFDLAYFFCTCSGKEVIQQLPKFLGIYHEILSDNLKEFECDPEKVFSFETLMDHWKKHSWFGVFTAMLVLKLMLSHSEEAPNMVGAMDEGQNIMEALSFDISKSSEYRTRLCDVIEFMADNNYI